MGAWGWNCSVCARATALHKTSEARQKDKRLEMTHDRKVASVFFVQLMFVVSRMAFWKCLLSAGLTESHAMSGSALLVSQLCQRFVKAEPGADG